jgi:hypothetical protein
MEAIHLNPENAAAYCNLGKTLALTPECSVTLRDGRRMTQQQLYIEAIKQDETYADAYFNLANTMLYGETVSLQNGCTITQPELLAETVRQNKKHGLAYHQLGLIASILMAELELPDGRVMSPLHLFREAINYSNHPDSYEALGVMMDKIGLDTIYLLGHGELSAQQLRAEAARLKRSFKRMLLSFLIPKSFLVRCVWIAVLVALFVRVGLACF